MKDKKILSKNGFRTTLKRSYTMSQIKSNDTVAEIILRKALWKEGVRYRTNDKSLPGKPDIVMKKHKLVIFVDGDFWHGYKWKWRKPRLKSNSEYWITKIEGNMKRDKEVNKILRNDGWKILRFWEHQVKNDVFKCKTTVSKLLK